MRRSVPVTILLTLLSVFLSTHPSLSQKPEDPAPAPLIESPPPTLAPPRDKPRRPDLTQQEQEDAVTALAELRSAVGLSPRNAEDRLNLAEGLYRIGDLDAAIEECRVAIRLKPDEAQGHLQLGVLLMAKQDWRAASSVLKEAIRLEPESPHAHYSLGSVQYTTGNVKAAIQSYRAALELQPNFPDARYRLALLLKLTNHEQEAAKLMEEAALGGVPQAQFFLGNAYKSGLGVEKNLAQAVFWWTKAEEFGHQPAAEALAKVRRQALSPDQSDRKRQEALDAFRSYRERLWEEFPDYSPAPGDETLGTRLLKLNRADDAIPTLLKETYALGDMAQAELARLYEFGWDQYLAPFDKHILACFETTAADGFLPAKKTLARIYGKGLGMAPDLYKAKFVLKGLPKQEMKALLDELAPQ
ncbi:MAG: tetratricopeptide repeat protein [Nitrospira sp. CR1.3]|nr:tetratricopeptide repeat protein [Nitrospira sp. CR1.3]